MTTDQSTASSAPDDLGARLAALLAEARSHGVDVSGLVGAAPGVTLREQLELRLPTLRRDHKGTYDLVHG